jgi:hypothetical protein
MAKITWLGEDDYREGEAPLSSCTWKGILFTAGDKVEVSDPYMIGKARGNRFFKVEDDPLPTQWREPISEADPMDVSFFDDPPGVDDDPPEDDRRGHDYPPEDRQPLKRKRGRPPKVRTNAD